LQKKIAPSQIIEKKPEVIPPVLNPKKSGSPQNEIPITIREIPTDLRIPESKKVKLESTPKKESPIEITIPKKLPAVKFEKEEVTQFTKIELPNKEIPDDQDSDLNKKRKRSEGEAGEQLGEFKSLVARPMESSGTENFKKFKKKSPNVSPTGKKAIEMEVHDGKMNKEMEMWFEEFKEQNSKEKEAESLFQHNKKEVKKRTRKAK